MSRVLYYGVRGCELGSFRIGFVELAPGENVVVPRVERCSLDSSRERLRLSSVFDCRVIV